jgi:hypothetical protein
MKYWNKTKKARTHWTNVVITSGPWDEMKLWCQRYPSKNRFYSDASIRIWYFEDPVDALVFKLIWPNIPTR